MRLVPSLTASPIPVGRVRPRSRNSYDCTQIGANGPLRSRESGRIADGLPPYPAGIFVQGPARRQSQEMLSLSERNSNKKAPWKQTITTTRLTISPGFTICKSIASCL